MLDGIMGSSYLTINYRRKDIMISTERAFKQAKQGMVSAPVVLILIFSVWYGISRFIIPVPRWILVVSMIVALMSFVMDLSIYLRLRNSIVKKPKNGSKQ
jgi:membrane protein YdbS with pleckstrin-like domain